MTEHTSNVCAWAIGIGVCFPQIVLFATVRPFGRSVHNVLPKVKTTPTPWQRPEIMFDTGHGPFPTYLQRFNIRSSDSCGCGNLGNPLHYATSCLFTTSYHLTKPSADLESVGGKES
ncbi:hypothetical protein AVEN_155503-1 [Araneus ventricosus]|uniref:Uncharacterized protein n=1 Tax=Araneus ventricosus TaxID=182803 RepID=A0A4Y2S275_ARAVE|nr:hypothetical protein AVEN_155503-1 [Araneus ventricosus]